MENIINPEVNSFEQDGLQLPQGMVLAKIIRSMLDGKMSGILAELEAHTVNRVLQISKNLQTWKWLGLVSPLIDIF